MAAATRGDATLYGASLSRDLSLARRHLGFCPQVNTLFDYLTCREHLELFGTLKGVEQHVIEKDVVELLAAVNLTNVGDHASSTFSGGMKRRLSTAISLIGGPKVSPLLPFAQLPSSLLPDPPAALPRAALPLPPSRQLTFTTTVLPPR